MQEGSKKLNKYLLKAVKILLIAVIVTAFTINIFKTDKTVSAGEYTITVNKVSTVSVYVSGPGVMLESSNTDKDVYRVDGGTTARFHAVNESRIFTGWDIKSGDTTVNDSTSSITTETVNSNLTVSVTRKDATTDDYGKYMLDRYVISDEAELIALQNILNGSTNNSDFAHFYDDANAYDTTDEKNTLRTAMNSGYYLIANNFVVFNSNFVGLGTTANPFNGVMCGLNNGVVSSIFSTISVTEQNGTNAYGLFKALGENAVIRNLNVVTTVGMTAATNNVQNRVQYIGGLAGTMNNSLLVSVTVEAKMGISVRNSALHVGGIVGYSTSGGFESVGNVKYNGDSTSWTIQSTSGSTINAGLVAGYAQNVYVNSMNIDVTNSTIDLKADGNATLTLGNLFGNYVCTSASTIKNINIMGSKGQTLRTVAETGESNVGGLIGKIGDDAQNTYETVSIGKVDFNVLGSKNTYISTTAGTSSTANLYTGGLIGQVSTNATCTALDTFKNRLSTISVDESEVKVFDYLFEGDYEITSVQNGTETATTNTKSVAGGLVGRGIININGTSNSARSSLVFASPSSSLIVNATQSKLSSINGTRNDKDHACAGLIYGTVGDESININNFDIYSNNTTIETLREIGSKSLGDLHTGGIIGYIEGSTIQNVGIFLNDSSILARSLSYEKTNDAEDTNSAYCGGVVGQATNNSVIDNVIFAGYNVSNANMVGTTSTMESIQNTIPGGGNYMGENYIGGIVGRMQYTKVSNCKYIGSEGSSDYIKMSGHESPDSAFCGGIVGIVRTATNNVPSSIQNCEIINAYIYAAATNIKRYNDPDIYVGGILGAAYMHNTNSTLEISDCHVYNTDIYGLGNDHMAVYVGGVLGGATWENDRVTISDSYVVNSNITANLVASTNADYRRKDNTNTNEIESAASGIVAATIYQANISVDNCAVIDTVVDAHTNYVNTATNARYMSQLSSYSAGFGAYLEQGITVTNCYSNALISSLAEFNSITKQDENDYDYATVMTGTIDSITDEIIIGTTTGKVNTITLGTTDYTVTWTNNNCTIRGGGNRSYLRININNGTPSATTNSNSNNATVFELEESTGRLKFTSGGNTYYLVRNNNSFSANTTGNNAINAIETVNVTETVEYGATYYLSQNVESENALGTAVPSAGFKPVTGTPVNIYNTLSTPLFNSADGYGKKMCFDPQSNYFISSNASGSLATIYCDDMTQYHSSLVNVWVNAKEDGDTTEFEGSPLEHYGSMENANNAGWFIFDTVIINNGVTANVNSTNITEIDSDYVDASNLKYEYSESDGSSIVTNVNDNTNKIVDRYFESKESNNYKYSLKVYDDMLSLKLNIVFANPGDYNIVISTDANMQDIVNLATANSNYGNITFTGSGSNYVLTFDPNETIESDSIFYIGFKVGDTSTYITNKIVIELVHNEIEIVGVTYADYTPPLNYYITYGTLGDDSDPYQLYTGSITKFIPVIKKSNDPYDRTYTLEEYIERYDYTVSTSDVGTIYSSGEFIASSTANISGTLTLTDKNDGSKSYTVYLKTVVDYTVTYNITGADIEGLTYATSSTDFYFEQVLRSNYSGKPTSVIIKRDDQDDLDLTSDPSRYKKDSNQDTQYVLVYELFEDGTKSANYITSWDADAYGYVIYVGKGYVEGNVTVTITYPITYTITFNLQCETFNGAYVDTMTFKVKAGSTYASFFGWNGTEFVATSIYQEVDTWAQGATIFGYVFKGFYMVDNASSLITYGTSFEDLAKSNNTISASITLYARWSFLIELIEAPGTHIVSSFPETFMEEYYEESNFNREIYIPINLNQGYVFTIEKDSTFKGEANVAAYSVKKNGDSHIITEIVLEKYHDNMYLYYVLPEYITGYLVIVTSVSNSEIIVGENTSSVIEEILPEDGVATFKYIVNHKNIPASSEEPAETSYIFNSGKDIDNDGDFADDKNYNLSVNRDFRLYFYKEAYNKADGTISKLPLELAKGTEIKVYYTIYYNDDKNTTENIVAVYKVTDDNTSYVKLNEFTLLDLYTSAFKSETFAKFMEGNQTISEIFYCVITPPNGLNENVKNEVINYIIEGGFYDENRSEFISGIRSGNELANKNDLNNNDIQQLLIESSKESKVFAVTPTRKTNVTKEGDTYTYTFTDSLTFELAKITFTDAQITGTYVSLYDDTKQSVLESGEFGFDIKEIRLTLGYGLGKVRIYGYNRLTDKWDTIEEVNVTNAVYTEYVVNFMSTSGLYNKIKIDNISTNEIRLNKFDIVSRTNGYVYQTTSGHLVREGGTDDSPTFSLIGDIVGDSRHDSKSFMLAIQLEDTDGNIIEDIRGSVGIKVGDTTYTAIIDQTGTTNYGKTVAYINLSSILNTLQTDSFDFTLIIPGNYQVHEMQLIEVSNIHKPAMGEVRQSNIN